MANPILRQKLAAGEFLVIPGVQDMIATVMTRKVVEDGDALGGADGTPGGR